VAALIGVRQIARHEGQAAMELEWLAARESDESSYPFVLTPGEPAELDWRPMVEAMLDETEAGASQAAMARRFHNTLAEMIATVASAHPGLPMALSGGCFQNRLLTELTIQRLEQAGARVYWHQRVPPSDGGIALGQVVGAARQIRLEESKREQSCV
jgi:hydrogenase maturation protein HypF